MAAAAALILFDIDGTLIRKAGPHHRQALEAAVRNITGLATSTDGIPVQGMLDRKILEEMLRRAGAPPRDIARHMPALVAAAQRIYLRNSPPALHDKVCPGVRPLLAKLSRRGIPAALVTGNLSRIGWRKMERAGLRRHFRFGAFAEQAHERAGLVHLALRQAARAGWTGPATPVWLVGDHPNDVYAAKSNGVRSVAVATGVAPAEELRRAQPDLLVDTLSSLTVETLLDA
ncbi:MAG: HAD family hydrolase [Acidobacteria bacterium]|nr:HAD family hydrolase [Acidobacteriota bacterium]